MREELRKQSGKRVLVVCEVGQVLYIEKRNIFVAYIQNVRFADGTPVSDHMWIELHSTSLKVGDTIRVSGVSKRYSKVRGGVAYYNYGLVSCRIKKKKVKNEIKKGSLGKS